MPKYAQERYIMRDTVIATNTNTTGMHIIPKPEDLVAVMRSP